MSVTLQRLLVGPRGTALRIGVPAIAVSFAVSAIVTLLVLRGNSGGGVYFPLDAVAIAVLASAVYAARYRALVVCVAIGVAALVGSDVGFHVLHGDTALAATLAELLRYPEPALLGGVLGVVGAAAGGSVGRVLRFRRESAA